MSSNATKKNKFWYHKQGIKRPDQRLHSKSLSMRVNIKIDNQEEVREKMLEPERELEGIWLLNQEQVFVKLSSDYTCGVYELLWLKSLFLLAIYSHSVLSYSFACKLSAVWPLPALQLKLNSRLGYCILMPTPPPLEHTGQRSPPLGASTDWSPVGCMPIR